MATTFDPPAWLVSLRERGDRPGVKWFTPERSAEVVAQLGSLEDVGEATTVVPRRRVPDEESMWGRMMPVADGPDHTCRSGLVSESRWWIDRDHPDRLLLSLTEDYPPSLWVPAAQTVESMDALLAAYFLPDTPTPSALPFQGRLFLTTAGSFQGGFRDVENRLVLSPFTDKLTWGNSHPADPYPPQVVLGQIPVGDLRGYSAQEPGRHPRTGIRTRHTRSVIQAIDWHGGFFADLFFVPVTAPADTAALNEQQGTDYPPGTPFDVIASLLKFACIGPERIRPQLDAEDDPDQREGMASIIGFLEAAPAEDC